jgi:hypothetical protein
LARPRYRRSFSLEALNAAIWPLLTDRHARPLQNLPGSRRSVFEALDRSATRVFLLMSGHRSEGCRPKYLK